MAGTAQMFSVWLHTANPQFQSNSSESLRCVFGVERNVQTHWVAKMTWGDMKLFIADSQFSHIL
jgi:hypothetical protein